METELNEASRAAALANNQGRNFAILINFVHLSGHNYHGHQASIKRSGEAEDVVDREFSTDLDLQIV